MSLVGIGIGAQDAPDRDQFIDCHLARVAALGGDVPEMPDCPLVPKDVSATVSTNATGFDVELKSWNEEGARDVWRRAQGLVRGEQVAVPRPAPSSSAP